MSRHRLDPSGPIGDLEWIGLLRPIRGLRRMGALVALAAILAGCLDATVPSAAPTPTRAPEPTPTVTIYQLGTTVWYEGLVIHFDQATATLDKGGLIEVALRIENPTADLGELDGGIHLVIGSIRAEPNRDSKIPSVAAHTTVNVNLTFELQGVVSADTAMLEVGRAPLHVGHVPFTASAGTAATFEPRTFGVSGTGAATDLRVTLRRADLRWDLPDWSQELDQGLGVLTLMYDVTYTGGFAGGLAFTGDNVALRLPDGKVVRARRDGHSQSIELIGPSRTKKDLLSRFEIPSGATGKFALLVRNGGAEKAIPFTINA